LLRPAEIFVKVAFWFFCFFLFFGVSNMKKSLIALAVLAASGASFAQSSVTIYGIADVYLGNTRVTGHDGVSTTTTSLGSGGVSTDRWGFKGSEDLGGGLKANFLLEQGFNIDTGAAKGTGNNAAGLPVAGAQAFARQSYVGFSGGFGEVKLGKMWTAFDDVNGATDAVFDSALSPMYAVFTSTNYNANPGNSFYYTSPSFKGFSGTFSYGLGENKTAAQSAGSNAAFNVQYTGGPVYVALGYQSEKDNGNVKSRDFTRVNASYDLGVVKLLGNLGRTKANDKSTNEWQLGVDYPVGSALTLSASYASSKGGVLTTFAPTAAGTADVKRTGFGIGASYSLSKRTSLYGGYMAAKEDANANFVGTADAETKLFAVGIRHTF